MKGKSKALVAVVKTEKNISEGGFSMKNETLYKDLKSYFAIYVDTNELEISLLVIYSCATHLYQRYSNFPILHITGDSGTGKNRRVNLIRNICHEPNFHTNPTIAVLFRTTGATRGTLIIDEADAILDSQRVRNFFLSGYEQGAVIQRMVQDNHHIMGFRSQGFEIYGPKILVTREGTDDEALNSRFITIVTLPMPVDSEVPYILSQEASAEGTELKARIEDFISDIDDINSENINLGLIGRDAQLFECLKDTACLFGEEAVQDLKHFIERFYIPEAVYDIMLTIQQELIRALDNCWGSGERAYLARIATLISNENSDYSDIRSQRIARVARGLGFRVVDRDSTGFYITPNDNLVSSPKK